MALELPELEVDDIVVGDDGHVGTISLIDGDNVTVAWSGNELTEENFDMLNELSRKKLSQYTRRAATDLGDAQYEKGRLSAARYTGSMSGDERRRDVDKRRVAFKKVINRSVGLDRATSKLAKEDELPEDETIDEKEKLGKPQKAGAKVKTKKAEADAEMAAGNKRMADALDRYDRAHGIIYRHIESKVPEDNETVNELSKKKLGSYLFNAIGDFSSDQEQAATDGDKYDFEAMTRDKKRASKRANGISKAIDTLTKEDEMAPVTDEELDEKWGEENVTKPSKRGMWNGWSLGDLRKARESAIGTRRKEIDFAIRAKQGWTGHIK